MAQIQGSGAGNYANTAMVDDAQKLWTKGDIIGLTNAEIIRNSYGSPGVLVVLSNLPESIILDNLGSSPVYFRFGSGTINTGSTNGFIPNFQSRTFDLKIGSFSFQGSGLTTPELQLIGIR